MMKLSPEEDAFLRHWMYDAVHFRDDPCPAKRLQEEHGVRHAVLSTLIAAAIPDPKQQAAAGLRRPDEDPKWPWETKEALSNKLALAREILAERLPSLEKRLRLDDEASPETLEAEAEWPRRLDSRCQ